VEPLTGQATPWNPAANFPVNAVAVQSNTVFLGGSFTKVGNQNRNCLAAADSATGRVTDWDPAPRGNFSTEVSVLLIDGETLYVGGNFSNISGQARENLASFSTRNGLLSDWNPGAMGWHVSAIAVADGVAYVGGIFGGIGGQSRANLAAVNLVNGQATAWQPRPSGGELSEVFALAVSGNTVYAGGEFYNIDGLPRRRLAALDAVTGQATSWNPYVDGFAVYALADGGGSLAMGGDFRIVGGLERSNLAALDTATGKPISWNPGVDGFVQCMASSGDTL